MTDLSEFVESFADRIAQRATEFAEWIEESGAAGADRPDEFETYVARMLTYYEPPRRVPDSALFGELYAAVPGLDAYRADPPDAEDAGPLLRVLAAGLLAAEVESRGPLRLGTRQQNQLAEVYERCGAGFRAAGLPRLAVLALRRAVSLYRAVEEFTGQDRSGLALERARTAAETGRRRLIGRVADTLCGYGYQPFRLLAWVVVELVVFTVVGLLTFRGQDWQTTLYMSTTSFLNPMGPGDTATQGPFARPVLAVESWAGTVSMSVYFALLVRLWFRM
ncbi:hypothetical protein [Nocardia stercoris]|uniref:Uncharacterized protein n=1 Tax=Nocardia stercoris TaxID=2483361 RepID=A0A3M2L8A1_9NOCA|nr:hypothetical protein [Nocardia stercoris]RMI33256.1 hypothetical protein EBN03_08700 [Nocardia stercoris]